MARQGVLLVGVVLLSLGAILVMLLISQTVGYSLAAVAAVAALILQFLRRDPSGLPDGGGPLNIP